MKRKWIFVVGLLVVVTVFGATVASAGGQSELSTLRAATARFHSPDAAHAAGYSRLAGLDYCFKRTGVGAMGFHLINAAQLDLVLDLERPEAMIYTPGPDGRLALGAVEYIVPAAPWDAAGNTQPPSIMGRPLHLNAALGVYVLHAWIWRENPAGLFEDWNPKVSCP